MPRSRHRKKPAHKRRRAWSAGFEEMDEPRGGVGDAIAQLVRPYIPPEATSEEVERLFSIGALAWNLSLLPSKERERELQRVSRKMFPPPRFRFLRLLFWMVVSRVRREPKGIEQAGDLLNDVAFERVVREMIERKEQLFPDA